MPEHFDSLYFILLTTQPASKKKPPAGKLWKLNRILKPHRNKQENLREAALLNCVGCIRFLNLTWVFTCQEKSKLQTRG